MRTKRQNLFTAGAILLLIAICVVMYFIGRGHTVYFDNKALEWEGQTYETPYKVEVYVKGERAAKLKEDERGMATWIGADFKMELVINQQKGDDDVSESYSVKLPHDIDGVIINIPGLMAGLPQEAYISEFIPAYVEEEDDEVIITDEFDMIGTGEEEGAE